MKQRTSLVEFVGGPYDGHCQELHSLQNDSSPIIAVPVCENVFRQLAGDPTGPGQRARIVALYQFHIDAEREHENLRYQFIGFRWAGDLGLQNWIV